MDNNRNIDNKEYTFIDYAPQPDADLLDSYSRTITSVVGQVAEAVVLTDELRRNSRTN